MSAICLVNGRIHTQDAAHRVAEGLVVVGDAIAFVGSSAEARAIAPPDARVVELGGRTVLPGFIDAHNHLAFTGAEMAAVDVRSPGVTSIAALVARIAEVAERTPDGRWIRAVGMNSATFEEGRLPTRWDLDAATRVHPVLVQHISGHHALANTMALEARGIDESARDPEGGHLVRDDRGRLTGYCLDAAQQLVVPAGVDIGHHGPGFHDGADLEEVVDDIARACSAYLAAGVTSIVDAQVTRRELAAYREARRRGLLGVRVTLMPISSQLDEYEALGIASGIGDEWLSIGPMKFYADGALTGGTAAFTEPYGQDGEFKGSLYWSSEAEFQAAIERAHRAGWQIGVHAQGDRAIQRVLDAYEAALAATPRPDARHRIEHCGGPRPDQLDRMARLGVIAIGQPRYFHDAGDDWLRALDPARANALQPYADMRTRGVRFVISTDAPVASYRPMDTISTAAARRTMSGQPIGTDHALSIAEAFRAYTIDAAASVFAEGSRGSLEPGKLADLVVLDGDAYSLPPDRLADVSASLTMAGGRVVYERVDG
jgi:predicted amidohydrolase YtcJ